jgi:hypothetical protein
MHRIYSLSLFIGLTGKNATVATNSGLGLACATQIRLTG